MENRLARLEARLETVEKELAELRQAMGLGSKQGATGSLGSEDQGFLDACSQAAQGGVKARIEDVRRILDWDSIDFDSTLERLSREGHVNLHADSGMGLSLKAMGEAFLGDDGQTYTEVSLAN